MKISLIFKKAFLVLFCYMLLSMQAAFGDDTEIFFAPVSSTANVIPNVLFIIDTSGSMTNIATGTAETRIDVVKGVMDDFLTDLQNVNIGLMRFNKGDTNGANSSEGGPILFPVTHIDAPSEPSVTAFISAGDDDGEEDGGGSGLVTIDANQLNIGLVADSITALRFESLNIPQGATILSANLVFNAIGDTSLPANLTVVAENVDDSAILTNTNFSISARKTTNSTSSEVSWLAESWLDGLIYSSDPILSVVQEVIDRPGWCGGNAMTFFITGDNLRSFYTREGSDTLSNTTSYFPAPHLKIKYANVLPGGASGCYQEFVSSRVTNPEDDWFRQTNGNISDDWDVLSSFRNDWWADGFGLSFSGLDIPAGATILSANLNLTAYLGGSDGAGGQGDIYGIELADLEPATPAILFASPRLGPISWNLTGEWAWLESIESPDISTLVQDIVNLGGWVSGNTMSFYMRNGFGDGYWALSRDWSTDFAPQIKIGYQTTYVSGTATQRTELRAAIAELPTDAWTPISDTMAEAGRYYRGDKVFYGIDRDNVSTNRTSHVDSFDNSVGTLVPPAGCSTNNYSGVACGAEEITGNPNYISPITKSCQTSHIVFLTDGAPTSHHQGTNDIYTAWTGGTDCSSDNYGSGCAVEIAGFLQNSTTNSSFEKTPIFTHTIGFDIDLPLLEEMANAGDGGYYLANNGEQLLVELQKLFSDIANVSTTFVSSGISVDQQNRLTHNDELYFSLFAPSGGNIWPGNVKRYKLQGSSLVDVVGDNVLGTDGKFLATAQSWWSDIPDGAIVNAGGAASNRTATETVYSDLSSDLNLTASANEVSSGNSLITELMLGATDAADRVNILDWARGLDVDSDSNEPHNVIGDPLHSQPTLVIYNTAAVDTPSYETKIYVGTNHGFLHAIDSSSGLSEWSFMPNDLLSMLSALQKGNGNSGTHAYGLDGSIATIILDDNNNGVVDITENEKAYLYIGMRRGGSNYYAIDISDPTAPKMLFTIEGGTGDFVSLGQTWSKPIIKRMNIGGVDDRLVMLFGGGYDTAQDLLGVGSQTDNAGNLVYIVDAISGEHLWNSRGVVTQASSPAGLITDMNGVTGEISALDLDGDGIVDTFYSSDTKAQIFRFDIDNDTQIITGGKIASLQTVNDEANNRRFYYKPDTALIRTTNETFISVSIGSGHRANPLGVNINDNFYMIKDVGALSANFDMMVERSNLVDITGLVGDLDGNGVSDARERIVNDSARGWYLTFSTGEKVLERSLTFNNAVLFTTYLPPGLGSNACEAAIGNSRLYALKIIDGNPYHDNLGDGLDETDRFIDLDHAGIAPPPQPVFSDEIRLCIGIDCSLGDLLPPTPDGVMGIRWRKQP